MKTSIASLFILLFFNPLFAQNDSTDNRKNFVHRPVRTSEKIRIDGVLDEKCWQTMSISSQWNMKWPNDQGLAKSKTAAQIAFDDQFLYVAMFADDPDGKYLTSTLKRDVDFWDSDFVAVALDPVGQKTNGFVFGVSSAGVQSEALLSTGGNDNLDFNWDNKWYSETRKTTTGYGCEMAIPLSILRFEAGQTEWGVNFFRSDMGNYEYSCWARVPIQFDGPDLGWMGTLKWPEPPAHQKGNLALVPYLTGSLSRNYDENETWKGKPNAGMDAKIAVTSSLNLDVTLNPDFSQIEIDEQQTNLTRFDIFLPEKRTFFLENADLFGGFGIPPMRPFFSRTIGLTADGAPVPIWAGARLSGNLNEKTRIGLMNMQTGPRDETPASNFTAATIQRRVLERSTAKVLFTNRSTFDSTGIRRGDFGRNLSAEWNFTNKKGTFQWWQTAHGSVAPNEIGKGLLTNTGFFIQKKRFDTVVDFVNSGKNYSTDLGYNFRTYNYDPETDRTVRYGYLQFFNETNFFIYPKTEKQKKRYNRHFFGNENLLFLNKPDNSFSESFTRLRYFYEMANTSELQFRADHSRVDALFDFDPTNTGLIQNLKKGIYDYWAFNIAYQSDYRKWWFIKPKIWYGGFYSGTKLTASTDIGFRVKQYGKIGVNFQYDDIEFTDQIGDVELFSIVPRIEVFLSRNIWWTTFMQYNTQADNFNINSRLQWRFRPMSDLFFVYTDNYDATNLDKKYRAFVLKFNYWLTR